jgi:hypothetical protein
MDGQRPQLELVPICVKIDGKSESIQPRGEFDIPAGCREAE